MMMMMMNKFFQIGSALKKRNPKQQKNKMTLIDTENTQNAKPKQTNTKNRLFTYLLVYISYICAV